MLDWAQQTMSTDDPQTVSRDPLYYRYLGRAIRVLRVERGLERKDLAARSGLSYPYLSEIESGKKRASSQALLAIAQALGVRPHELLATAEALARRDEPADVEGYAASTVGPHAANPPSPARFFHAAEAAPPAYAPSPEPLAQPTSSAPAPAERSTGGSLATVLAELRWRLERMASDDVARLLDLARRLTR